MATLNGIYYDELPGSPTFAGARDGPTAQRKLKVAWSDMNAFLLYIFPASIPTGNGWAFPVSSTFPGRPWLTAQGFKVGAFDEDNATGYDAFGVRAYSWAVITLDYKAPEYDPEKPDPGNEGDQILADYSAAYSAEMLKLGIPGWLWFGTDSIGTKNQPIMNEDASLAKLVAQIDHSITWNYVPSPPLFTISQFVGSINSDARLFYAPIGTLLFAGAEIKRSYHSQTGAEAWKVTYKFVQRCIIDHINDLPGLRSVGWNYMYRPDTQNWDAPFRWVGGTQEFIYQSNPFLRLFRSDGSAPR